MKQHPHDFILTIACPDAKCIVFRVSEFLFQRQCNILDSAQFGDDETGLFFLRIHFEHAGEQTQAEIEAAFTPLASQLQMTWRLHSAKRRSRVLVMVSRQGHCLNDLMFRWSTGQLPIEITGVISNHRDHETLVAHHKTPFYYLPVDPANKAAQEQEVLKIMQSTQVDFVVLARYMQILSADLCQQLEGRAINIHHSFLPSFKGAKPYEQAHSRGVKIIGATAHYVTTDLDEGPIIEQDTERVDHSVNAADLTSIGADIECRVLARAVKWHAEHRILINGKKTVVFR
jgi:formyltetrahydrofolate deformylase